jgi:hypothetical protein
VAAWITRCAGKREEGRIYIWRAVWESKTYDAGAVGVDLGRLTRVLVGGVEDEDADKRERQGLGAVDVVMGLDERGYLALNAPDKGPSSKAWDACFIIIIMMVQVCYWDELEGGPAVADWVILDVFELEHGQLPERDAMPPVSLEDAINDLAFPSLAVSEVLVDASQVLD